MTKQRIGRLRKVAETSRRHLKTSSLALMIVAALVMAVQAVHDTGAFELDGNAFGFNAGAPLAMAPDWEQVYLDVLNGTATSGATAVSFATEPALNSTIFQGGGSKDPIDIDSWAWKDESGGLPDKDNLLHSFAARYSLPPTDPGTGDVSCPNGTGGSGQPAFDPTIPCEVLYFGSDRFDNSGDAQQGFWFFQNAISLGANKVGGGTGFIGVHEPGDLLVISDFSVGGTTSTISIFSWDPTCLAANNPDPTCADSNLRRLATSAAANCATVPDGDAFCGLVNSGGQPSPWPFLDKSGNMSFASGELYEGGVNLSLLGLAGECFASVASETRSSTSTNAVLKDFVLGGFADCTTGLVTTPRDGSGAAFLPAALSIGTGTVTVTDSADLTISGAAVWSGTLNFYLCAPSELTDGVCSTGGTAIGSGIAVNQGTSFPVLSAVATVSSVGNYCWRGEFISSTSGVPDAVDASSGECFAVAPVTPALLTSATASVEVGNAIEDSATLSMTANGPGSPVVNPTTAGAPAGGSITFRLYGPSDTDVCTESNLVFTSSAVGVAGNGTYGPVSFTPTVAGTYRWIGTYTGDAPNTSGPVSGGCGDTFEVSVVSPKQPAITTDATADPPTGAPVGTAISDTATLSGTATGAGGTITFSLYGPDDATCSTTAIFTSTKTVSGDGSYVSDTFTPTAPGTYRWIAAYSGDSPNTLPVSGSCNDANEASLIIALNPSVATAQFFYPNDSATITVASGGGALAGNVRFRVWTNATCTGTPLFDSGNIDVTTGTGGDLSRYVETANLTNRVSGNVSVYWIVDYDSNNDAHADFAGTCGMEQATIAVVDLP